MCSSTDEIDYPSFFKPEIYILSPSDRYLFIACWLHSYAHCSLDSYPWLTLLHTIIFCLSHIRSYITSQSSSADLSWFHWLWQRSWWPSEMVWGSPNRPQIYLYMSLRLAATNWSTALLTFGHQGGNGNATFSWFWLILGEHKQQVYSQFFLCPYFFLKTVYTVVQSRCIAIVLSNNWMVTSLYSTASYYLPQLVHWSLPWERQHTFLDGGGDRLRDHQYRF